MTSIPEFERRFTNELLPWQVSRKPFDFNQEFVSWIHRRYLPIALSKDAKEIERWQAMQWLNKARFGEERYEDALLQWHVFQAEAFKAEEADQQAQARRAELNSPDFDPNTPEAIAVRERVREMLKKQGLL